MKARADKTTSAQHLGLVCRSVKVAAGFVELELAFLGRWLGALPQTRNLGGRQRLEGSRRFQSLVQNLLGVDPGNLRGDRQVEAVVQGLDGFYRVTVENKVIAETLHAQHSDAFAVEHWKHFVGKAAKAVNLGHQEYFVAVTACQRLTHPHFADAVVVIPAVIHEGDAMIDGAADELNGFLLLKRRLTDMIAAQPNRRDAFPSAAQCAIDHSVTLRGLPLCTQHGCQQLLRGSYADCRCRRLQEIAPVHNLSWNPSWAHF